MFTLASQLSLLSEPPAPMFQNECLHKRIPVRQTLLLDPWMEPMADPGPKPYSDGTEAAAPDPNTASQLLIIESEVCSFVDDRVVDADGRVPSTLHYGSRITQPQ